MFTNLGEGVSVGLQADFHHFERIDDNGLRQACAEPRHGQRLEGRWTRSGLRMCRIDKITLTVRTIVIARELQELNSKSQFCVYKLVVFVSSKMDICFCQACQCCRGTNV